MTSLGLSEVFTEDLKQELRTNELLIKKEVLEKRKKELAAEIISIELSLKIIEGLLQSGD